MLLFLIHLFDDIHVVEPFNLVVPDTFKLSLGVDVEGFVKLLIYVNNVVSGAFKLY